MHSKLLLYLGGLAMSTTICSAYGGTGNRDSLLPRFTDDDLIDYLEARGIDPHEHTLYQRDLLADNYRNTLYGRDPSGSSIRDILKREQEDLAVKQYKRTDESRIAFQYPVADHNDDFTQSTVDRLSPTLMEQFNSEFGETGYPKLYKVIKADSKVEGHVKLDFTAKDKEPPVLMARRALFWWLQRWCDKFFTKID